MNMKLILATATLILGPQSVLGQAQQQQQAQPQSQTSFAPSGRATSEIAINDGGATITVDYGQPHARGREIFGTLVPLDTVWRLGANRATQLTTDIALTIGGTRLAPGSYSLALVPSRTAPLLVINSRTRHGGAPYNAAGEIARVAMRVETLSSPVETLSVTLVPNPSRPSAAAPAPGTGMLVIAWGTMRFSVDFSRQP